MSLLEIKTKMVEQGKGWLFNDLLIALFRGYKSKTEVLQALNVAMGDK